MSVSRPHFLSASPVSASFEKYPLSFDVLVRPRKSDNNQRDLPTWTCILGQEVRVEDCGYYKELPFLTLVCEHMSLIK